MQTITQQLCARRNKKLSCSCRNHVFSLFRDRATRSKYKIRDKIRNLEESRKVFKIQRKRLHRKPVFPVEKQENNHEFTRNEATRRAVMPSIQQN